MYYKNTMRNLIALIVILGFLGLSVFGYLAMRHESGQGHSFCAFIDTIKGDCPNSSAQFSFLNFHINAFKSFSSAVFSNIATSAILLLSLLILLFGFEYFRDFLVAPFRLRPTIYKIPFFGFSDCHLFKKLTHWLTIKENSPNFLQNA